MSPSGKTRTCQWCNRPRGCAIKKRNTQFTDGGKRTACPKLVDLKPGLYMTPSSGLVVFYGHWFPLEVVNATSGFEAHLMDPKPKTDALDIMEAM